MRVNNQKTLILGLGNDILTDDAIGIIAVRRLSKIFKDRYEFDFSETTEMGLALLDYIEGYKRLVVIDSIFGEGYEVGMVRELNMEDFAGAGCSTPHFLGLKDTIELGRKMDMIVPEDVLILGIGVEDPFSVSEKLSLKLREKLDDIVEEIGQKIENFTRLTTHG